MTRKISLVLIIASLVFGAAVGCGSSGSNNDQGTSFLAFGFFADVEGTTGSSGAIVPLATDVSVDGSDGLEVITFMGLQNRLSTQFIRIVRIDCSYDIPGASPLLDLPTDSYNTSFVISSDPSASPTGGDDGTGAQPGGPAAGTGSVGYIGFVVLSRDMFSYINVNRNQLPELPFRMTATCSAVGVTQSGDTLRSNELNFQINFVDVAECCTGAPDFQTGPGSGGGITFEDGSSSESTTGAAAAG